MGCNPPDQVLCSNRSASGQGVREARRGDRPEGGLKTRESPPLQDGEYVKFKNLESGGDTSSAEGPVTACCPSRHGSASAMEPHSVARKGRAGSGRTARLGSHRHPREKSSAPPWSKPLLTSNQPWAQKRNAATTANPTQSGQWGRPMQIIRLPQLDGAGPPGANPWRESRQFCTSPAPSAPCCRLSVPRRSRQQGQQSAPDWQRWLGPGGAGAARTVIPTEVAPRKAGSGNGGSNPLLAGNHSRDRPAWAGLCLRMVGMA